MFKRQFLNSSFGVYCYLFIILYFFGVNGKDGKKISPLRASFHENLHRSLRLKFEQRKSDLHIRSEEIVVSRPKKHFHGIFYQTKRDKRSLFVMKSGTSRLPLWIPNGTIIFDCNTLRRETFYLCKWCKLLNWIKIPTFFQNIQVFKPFYIEINFFNSISLIIFKSGNSNFQIKFGEVFNFRIVFTCRNTNLKISSQEKIKIATDSIKTAF